MAPGLGGSTKMHWQYNLFNAMNDPNLIVYKDRFIVIIKDKYPKSEQHFLVLPQGHIPDVRCLNSRHLKLLIHMEKVTEDLMNRYPDYVFWSGFHANPTMVQLHMHVVSDDFTGSGLKTREHYNSKTTTFFVPLLKVIEDLKSHGKVVLPLQVECKRLLEAPLVCHKCGCELVNIPTLKVHLLSHHIRSFLADYISQDEDEDTFDDLPATQEENNDDRSSGSR